MAKKILLADDSVTIQKVISITLANEDYELIVVGDGDSAVAKIKELKPDLVMADVAMPGKTGYEVCEIVKNDPALRNTPVLLLAGTFEPLNRGEAERVRADENITKPFESHELLDKIRYLLSKSQWLEAEEKPAEKEEEFVSPSAVYEEAQPKVEISEDIWESGGFLGFSEETEKALESKPEPASDLSFLEEEIFEHRHDLEGEKFADFRLGTEDSGRIQAPPPPPVHEFSFGEEEEMRGPSEAAGAPFDLETFMAEPSKEKTPSPEPAREQAPPVEGSEELSLSEEPYSFPEERFKAEAREAPEGPEPAQAPAEPESFDFGALRAEGFEPEVQQNEEHAEEFFDLGKEPFEVSAAKEAAPPPLVEPETARVEAPTQEQAPPREIEPERIEFIDEPLPAVERMEPTVSFEAIEPVKEAVYEPEPHLEGVAAEISERAEAGLIEEAASRLEGRIEVPREEVREIIAKMAREIIQEVAWEVVPDLAEEIIRAEIDRIKQALLKLQ